MSTITMNPNSIAHDLRTAAADYERIRKEFEALAFEYEQRADRQKDDRLRAADLAAAQGHYRTAAAFAFQRNRSNEWAVALESGSLEMIDGERIVAHVEEKAA